MQTTAQGVAQSTGQSMKSATDEALNRTQG
jgi:hypothetical protein